MTADEERRHIARLDRDVADARARLDAGLTYGAEDRARIRAELVAADQRVAARLAEIRDLVVDVERECKEARQASAQEWQSIRRELAGIADRVIGLDVSVAAGDKRAQRRASTTVAWIGGAFLLLSSLLQTLADVAK